MLPRPAGPSAPHTPRSAAWCSPELTVCLPLRQVVEELLSGNPHIEKESARSIADGAMMEAASVCVGQMVRARGPCPHPPLSACGALPSVSLCFWKAWRAETARGLLTTPAGPGAELCPEAWLLSCPTRPDLRPQS